MGRRPIAALVAIAALAAVLPACGSGDDGAASAPDGGQSSSEPTPSASDRVLAGSLPLLDGRPQDLDEYRGKVVLVVNTASECGFTPQFDGLERLYRSHRDDGFVILGFPADDVAGQEPRSDEQIAEFCEENFGVSFPMFAKSNVVDDPVNPLFERLAAEAGAPTWNFNKYLLDRDGEVVERYDAGTSPEDAALTGRIEGLL
jgi:glutathione peroxidase